MSKRKVQEKRYVEEVAEHLELLTRQMPCDEGQEAAESAVDFARRLASIGREERALEILDWIEEDVVQPILDDLEEEREGSDVHVLLDVNLGNENKNLSHAEYLQQVINTIKCDSKTNLKRTCKVKLISYE
jgi:nucleotide-binding universal stress UspA family protein